MVVVLLLIHRSFTQNDTCATEQSAGGQLCSELFQIFQAALVGSDANLFNLRKMFFPSSKASPVLLNVSYTIKFGDITNIPCQEDVNNVNTFETFYKNTTLYFTLPPSTDFSHKVSIG